MIRGIYDSGFAGANGTDMAGHLSARNVARFEGALNLYLHVMAGTQGNALRLADALAPLGMQAVAIGNAFDKGAVERPQAAPFDLVTQPDFRTRFGAHPNAGAVYLADEPDPSIAANVVKWQGIYKQSMPAVPTLNVLLGMTADPRADPEWWAAQDTGDWLAADVYPVGGPAETAPHLVATYGYTNFHVAESLARVRAACDRHGKVPIAVLQAMRHGTASRTISTDELWSHMVMAIAEGCQGVIWWAMGVQAGALHTPVWSAPERERVLSAIEAMGRLLGEVESAVPVALAGNSSATGTRPLEWRLGALDQIIAAQGQWSLKQTYMAERDRLLAGGVTSAMLDQAGDIRARAFRAPDGTGYVFAYNHSPAATLQATLTWPEPLARVEVIGEGREIEPSGASFADTWGASASLRQGRSRQGHVYRLTPAAAPAPVPPPPLPTPPPLPVPPPLPGRRRLHIVGGWIDVEEAP